VEKSLAQTQALVSLIAEHTRGLAAANHVQLDGLTQVDGGAVVELRGYLEMQGQIFRDAA
jgi:hypothetical protein